MNNFLGKDLFEASRAAVLIVDSRLRGNDRGAFGNDRGAFGNDRGVFGNDRGVCVVKRT